jgi:hypothetical protein
MCEMPRSALGYTKWLSFITDCEIIHTSGFCVLHLGGVSECASVRTSGDILGITSPTLSVSYFYRNTLSLHSCARALPPQRWSLQRDGLPRASAAQSGTVIVRASSPIR